MDVIKKALKINAGNPNPSPATRFKKGQCGYSAKRAKNALAKQIFKDFTQRSVSESYAKMCQLNKPTLERMCTVAEIPAIEHIIAKCLLDDIKRSKMDNLNKILDRVIGPIPTIIGTSSLISPNDLSSLKEEELDDIIKRNIATQ